MGEQHYKSRKFKDALKAFEHALHINQSPILSVQLDSNLIYNTALAAYESKEWEKAITYLSKLNRGNYSTNVAHLLYTLYLKKNDTLMAETVLVESVKSYDDNKDLVLLLADLLYVMNEIERAVAVLDSACVRDSSNYIFPYTKGLVYQKSEQYSKAISAYEESILLAPDEAKIYLNIGTCYYNIGVEIDVNARTITNNTEFLEEKAKSAAAFDAAVTWLEKAYDLDSKNQKVIKMLYELYSVLGITDKVKDMENLIE